jgi:hypothetical protein
MTALEYKKSLLARGIVIDSSAIHDRESKKREFKNLLIEKDQLIMRIDECNKADRLKVYWKDLADINKRIETAKKEAV